MQLTFPAGFNWHVNVYLYLVLEVGSSYAKNAILVCILYSSVTLFHTYLQAPQILCSIVLLDPMTADFNIDGVWLVMSDGKQRPLNGTRAIEGVGIQINQKISSLDWIHVKVKVLLLYISFYCWHDNYWLHVPSLIPRLFPTFTT